MALEPRSTRLPYIICLHIHVDTTRRGVKFVRRINAGSASGDRAESILPKSRPSSMRDRNRAGPGKRATALPQS